MSDFYITLPSHSSKSEFPENKGQQFQDQVTQSHTPGGTWMESGVV